MGLCFQMMVFVVGKVDNREVLLATGKYRVVAREETVADALKLLLPMYLVGFASLPESILVVVD